MTLQTAGAASLPPRVRTSARATAGPRVDAGKRPRLARSGNTPASRDHPFRRQDLAFQKAVLRAIAAGKENPPAIGVFKDLRPFDAPRLFEPVPHASGCTSPARECAELIAVDAVATPVCSMTMTPVSGHNSGEGDA